MPTFEFNGPDGKTYSVDGPAGSTPEQAFAILQQQLGDQNPVTTTGLAKAVGIGAVKGTLGLAGAPADLTGLAAKGYDAISGSKYAESLQPLIDQYGSSGLQKSLESYTGKLREPANRAEEIANTVGEFAPLAVAGPGGIARKVATNVLAPAAGAEIAKSATEGTDLQPYATVAGAVLGGGIGSRIGRGIAETKQAIANAPGADIKAASQGAYKDITANTVATPIKQAELDNLVADAKASLNKEGLRPSVADKVHSALDEIKAPATAGAPDVADLVAGRLTLKNLLKSPDANSAAAVQSLAKVDSAIERLSPGTMAKLREADRNWAGYKADQALSARFGSAELRAAAQHSGMNLGNITRQSVTSFLNSGQSKYLSAQDRAILEKFVKGTLPQNAIRMVSNLLGGGGGLGSTLLAGAGAVGGYESGHPELAMLPIAGLGLRSTVNRMTLKQAAKAAADIRNNSPYGQVQLAKNVMPAENPIGQALLRAMAARQLGY